MSAEWNAAIISAWIAKRQESLKEALKLLTPEELAYLSTLSAKEQAELSAYLEAKRAEPA